MKNPRRKKEKNWRKGKKIQRKRKKIQIKKIRRKVTVKKKRSPQKEKKNVGTQRKRRRDSDDDYDETPAKRRRVSTTKSPRKSPRKSPKKSPRKSTRKDSDSSDSEKPKSQKHRTELQKIDTLKKVIRGCGFKVQGITKNMSNTKIIQKLQQIMSEYENEGMKERMTIKEIKKFKAIRASDKELADLQLAKKNISQGKKETTTCCSLQKGEL